ncbi:hypothetical protein GZ77_16200 [Endozoicomonas montiporae]|uniref:Uncharacterized protein n=2 Tax=Endozoicomonas montiporae TaxID=1027273 RepID=A0A081N5U2_9GAMM|nr:hypothetical protein [Endozoicomonas montiporae]AMO57284.1 hypothetical protein EZMO1_3285 [Endozoicomonas montiporae CL-33]KEQ13815.1 hypothetical protein GZ77_16200 [Endozoicomonas montiporae]
MFKKSFFKVLFGFALLISMSSLTHATGPNPPVSIQVTKFILKTGEAGGKAVKGLLATAMYKTGEVMKFLYDPEKQTADGNYDIITVDGGSEANLASKTVNVITDGVSTAYNYIFANAELSLDSNALNGAYKALVDAASSALENSE